MTEPIATRTFRAKNKPQQDVLFNDAPNLLFHGPWGTGKTHVGAAKALYWSIKYPPNRVALVRKKRVDLKGTLWKWFIDKVLPPEAVAEHNDTDLFRKLNNGSEIEGLGLDSALNVVKLASREYGLVIVEEAREITEQDFDEKLSRCLRFPGVPKHQLLLLTNPDAPSHFLYKRFFTEKWNGYEKIQGKILPNLPKSYRDRIDQLTGIYRLRYKEGKWAAFEGLVYPFDPGKHIIDGFVIPEDWRRIIAVDFGFDHPFVCQWWAISPDDRWYMYREIYHTHRTVNTHAPDILKYCKQDGIEASVICDHDAEDAATLREHKIKTRNAKKDRLAGQQVVYDKIDADQVFFSEMRLWN